MNNCSEHRYINKVPTPFQKWNSRTFQGLSKDKITFFKHYQKVIWHVVWVLFCDELTCHIPYCNSIQIVCCCTVYTSNCTVEDMDCRINYDRDFMTKLQKTHKQIRFLEPLFLKSIKSYFQALFKENWQFSKQIDKSSTFQDSIQFQALFKVSGNHDKAKDSFMCLRQWLKG